MAYIQGTDRLQKALFCLEDFVATDAPVRVVDAFCEQVDYVALNFRGKFSCDSCRPNYHPSILLRLYLYGYLNGIRSSRKLEQECTRNVEVMWLCNNLVPKYHTIADFRKLHPMQILELFKQFVAMMCKWKLIGKKTVAIDGTRYRAQNSKKNNYSEEKIKRQMTYIDNKVTAYLEEMDTLDKVEKKKGKDIKRLQQLAWDKDKMKQRKKHYLQLKQQLQKSTEAQISTVDPQSRALVIKTDVVEVAYNTQVATDAKNSLLVHYAVTNQMDRKALHSSALSAKENMGLLQQNKLNALADKGFFNQEQLHRCKEDSTFTFVPVQGSRPAGPIPAKGYWAEDFMYHKKADTYTCPQGHVRSTNGMWYWKNRDKKGHKYGYIVKHYKTHKCLTCPVFHLCTNNKKGRLIERSEYAEAVEENLKWVKEHKEKYLKRQQIVEHAFGTIKRGWGYCYTLMKGLRKVSADMGLIYLCYNLKRVMNILTPPILVAKLQRINN
jgi:transposase